MTLETLLAQAGKKREMREADERRSSRAAEARRSYSDLAFPYKLWHDMSGDERDACFSSKEVQQLSTGDGGLWCPVPREKLNGVRRPAPARACYHSHHP